LNGIASFLIQLLFLCSVVQLLVTANVFPSSLIIFTLMMEDIRSSETSVLTRVTRRCTPEDSIIYSHCRENLRSFMIGGSLEVAVSSSESVSVKAGSLVYGIVHLKVVIETHHGLI
jgi:hypothetical protein